MKHRIVFDIDEAGGKDIPVVRCTCGYRPVDTADQDKHVSGLERLEEALKESECEQ